MRKFNVAQVVALTIILSILVSFGGKVSGFLKISVLGFPEHAPFDGTVYPVEKVPNWVKVGHNANDEDYSDLDAGDFMPIPYYDAERLATPTDQLRWGNSEDDKIRNEKLTYTVLYNGTYKLDWIEGIGSHPAVDMPLPYNTPIRSIMNGVVVKVGNQSGGFGPHVVVQHNNVPSLEDPNEKVTLYSSYSHLIRATVDVGDVVKKGQVVGKSGNEGFSTTPHLHFQLDNDKAPWHPYWPFSSSAAAKAGYNFVEAVNAGFGLEEAKKTTVHPMAYVQKYLDGAANGETITKSTSGAQSVAENVKEEELVVVVEVQEVEEEVVVEEEVRVPSVVETAEVSEVSVVVNKDFKVGEDSLVKLVLKDENGSLIKYPAKADIFVRPVYNRVELETERVSAADFSNGSVSISFDVKESGKDRFKVSLNDDETFVSTWFEVKEVGDKFSDVASSSRYFEAITFLAEEGIVAGYQDGTFKPNKNVGRVEALKLIYEGIDKEVEEGYFPFRDASKDDWYGAYLYTAYRDEVVSGDPDGKFRPAATVNRAEFYKMLFNGMGVRVDMDVAEKPFEDVEVDAWYAPYFAYAKELGIIDEDLDEIDPTAGMRRGEVADAMYRLMREMR